MIEAPSYVRRIPNGVSAVLAAEALADLLATGLAARRPIAERDEFIEGHNQEVYVAMLLDVLGCPPSVT